jgi:DNA-binding transcriptional MocR family regulator
LVALITPKLEIMNSLLATSSTLSLTEQLGAQLRERIRHGLLAPGARLPSVRECARRYSVSPFTVVAAYDRLQAQGLIEAQRGRGFFVRAKAANTARAAPAQSKPKRVDAGWLIRGMFNQLSGVPQPGSGTLPAAWLDNPHVAPAMREAARAAPEQWLQYGDPKGLLALRQLLALRMNEQGVEVNAEQILTTNGATHALDLVSRALLHAGDTVLVESPGWFVEFARYAESGVRMLSVPRVLNGPDLDVLEALVKQHKPKLFVCVAKLHNPTGTSMSTAVSYRLLQLAAQYRFLIVEDDTYADFAEANSSVATTPRLAALDGLQRVVYVSSFSKSLAPAWRCGFVAAAPELLERLTDLKLISTLTTQCTGEMAIQYVLATGAYRRHMSRMTEHLQQVRPRVARLAEQHDCSFSAPVSQGLFAWVDTGVDTEKLALALIDEGWLIAPGALFYPERSSSQLSSTHMRINFATSGDLKFWRALAKARDRLLT